MKKLIDIFFVYKKRKKNMIQFTNQNSEDEAGNKYGIVIMWLISFDGHNHSYAECECRTSDQKGS